MPVKLYLESITKGRSVPWTSVTQSCWLERQRGMGHKAGGKQVRRGVLCFLVSKLWAALLHHHSPIPTTMSKGNLSPEGYLLQIACHKIKNLITTVGLCTFPWITPLLRTLTFLSMLDATVPFNSINDIQTFPSSKRTQPFTFPSLITWLL